MILKKKAVLTFACFMVLVTIVMGSGCTTPSSGNQSTFENNISAPTTTIAPLNATTGDTAVVTAVKTTRKPTTARTTAVKTTKTQKTDILTVTLNSALKQTKIGSHTPSSGSIYLVLDVTIQKNDHYNDFDYTDKSFVIIDEKNEYKRTALTSRFTSGLNSPLSTGKIIMQQKKSGQIVFSVTNNLAKSYTLNIVDSTGTLLTSLDDIIAA
jgi:hypothetical protein